MWSSRIFTLIGRASPARFISPTSRLCTPSRTFVTPAIAAIDRVNFIPSSHGATTACANSMDITRSNLPSHPMTNNIRLPFHETRRCMSKYLSKSAAKRLPLTTKRAKKGYYKGKGGTSEGRLTSKGKFIADPLKKLNLVVPDMKGFTLKPYIARTVSKTPPEKRTKVVTV